MWRSPQTLRCAWILGAVLVLAGDAVVPSPSYAQSAPPSGTWQDKRPTTKGGTWNPAGNGPPTKTATPAQQSNAGNSGRLSGDGLELEWQVTGADVGPRFFADRTWQAGGVVTSTTVHFKGVMRASVPKGFATDSNMSAYISLGMGVNRKETKWGGELSAGTSLSHEMPFDLTLDAPPGGTVLVSASVNKVGGTADLLAVTFQFAPRPKTQANPSPDPTQKDTPAPPLQTSTVPASPASSCAGACLASRDVCLKAIEIWTPLIAQLDSTIPEQKRALRAFWAEQKAADDEDGPLSSPSVRFPPVGAAVNESMGEREGFADLVTDCRAEIARIQQLSGGSPASADPAAADYRAAFDAFATRFASVAQTRREEKWKIAQERKASFNAAPKEFRFAAETNYYTGYSEACRTAAEQLRKLRFGGG